LGDQRRLTELIARCRTEAQRYAYANPVCREPLELRDNAANEAGEDIVVGHQERPLGGRFVPADLDAASELCKLNAVRIHASRTRQRGNPLPFIRGPMLGRVPTDMSLISTAMLDHAVIGVKPTNREPFPLAPIGIFSDPSGAVPHCWESRIDRRLDGEILPTIELRFGHEGGNACLLQIGTRDASEFATQLAHGVCYEHLSGFGGELVLGHEGQLRIPASLVGPDAGGASEQLLASALQRLANTNEPRIWPLYRAVDASTGEIIVTGFVAARVVGVERHARCDRERAKDMQENQQGDSKLSNIIQSSDNHGHGKGHFLITLQAAMMCTASAITQTDRPKFAVNISSNRFLCKVRLVQ
jgi:hypothetical protein